MASERDSTRLTLLMWASGLMGSLLLAAIPWAFKVGNDVVSVETQLFELNKKFDHLEIPPKWFAERVLGLEARIERIEREKPKP